LEPTPAEEQQATEVRIHEFAQVSTFAAYLALYHTGCWAVSALCVTTGVVAASTGLDWEIYLLWLGFMMLTHVGCLGRRFQDELGSSPPLNSFIAPLQPLETRATL